MQYLIGLILLPFIAAWAIVGVIYTLLFLASLDKNDPYL